MRLRLFPHALASLFAAAILAGNPVAVPAADADLARIAAFFATAQVVHGPERIGCTLAGGTQTNCFSITVRHLPRSYTPGPWCPANIAYGADAGGIWFRDGAAVEVDGAFIASLADMYDDTNWQLFDPATGAVRFTGTLAACEAAARPDVDPAYENYCVQCLPEYLPADTTLTYVIPLDPVRTDRPGPVRGVGAGIALNGVRLDGPAPVDAILAAYTIAPFDDCGGHVNTHVGYHYHAVTDCLAGAATTIASAHAETVAAHGGQIGIAMDGHAIFAHVLANGEAPGTLDACNGHDAPGLPYHYHAGSAGANEILGCFVAQAGCTLAEGQTVCDASRRPPRP